MKSFAVTSPTFAPHEPLITCLCAHGGCMKKANVDIHGIFNYRNQFFFNGIIGNHIFPRIPLCRQHANDMIIAQTEV